MKGLGIIPTLFCLNYLKMRKPYLFNIIQLCYLIYLLGYNNLFSQSYAFNPGKLYTVYLDTNQIYFNGIEVKNISNQNLNLTWELTLKDTLPDSMFDLCNSGQCLIGLPANGAMPTLLPGETGWLKLHHWPGKTLGLNTIKYVLKNGALQTDTLTFQIYLGISTLLKEFKNNNDQFVLFPNPANAETTLLLTLLEPSDVSISILDNLGQIVYKSSSYYKRGINSINVDTYNYKSGCYSIEIITKKGVVSKRLSISK